MDNQKFEVLLSKDRNWLSRYGGFVSLLLIAALVVAIVGIEIPKYEQIVKDTDGHYHISIQDEINRPFALGDTLVADTNDLFLIIDIKKEDEKKTVRLVSLSKDKNTVNGRYLIENQSLLKSLLEPVFKMNKD